jgi:hypothetical protein
VTLGNLSPEKSSRNCRAEDARARNLPLSLCRLYDQPVPLYQAPADSWATPMPVADVSAPSGCDLVSAWDFPKPFICYTLLWPLRPVFNRGGSARRSQSACSTLRDNRTGVPRLNMERSVVRAGQAFAS